MFHDFFPFVFFEPQSHGQPIKNFTIPRQVVSLNPNVVYTCLPSKHLSPMGAVVSSVLFIAISSVLGAKEAAL